MKKFKKRSFTVMLFTANAGYEKEKHLLLMRKNIACILLLFFLITDTVFSQQQDIGINGTNNIAQTLKSSLSSIPNLRVGNLSFNVSTYGIRGSDRTSEYMRFYIEGTLSVDYFEIVMSDGKAIRFTQSGNSFSCGTHDFPAGVDGPRSHSFSPYAKVTARGKTELGTINEQASIHFSFNNDTFRNEWGGQKHNNNVGAVRSINISCSAIESFTLEDIKKRVRLLRENYDLLKNQNTSSNTSNSTGNNNSNNRSSNNQNNTSSNNSNNNASRQRSTNNSQSQPVWGAYQQTLSNTQQTLDEWQRVREANEEEDDGEREESTAERKRREYAEAKEREERERKEREAENRNKENLAESRKSVLKNYPTGELPTSATKVNSNKLYYFIYTHANDFREQAQFIYVSNVFAIGQYPDGTWPMKTTVQAEINKLTNYTEYIHGYYTSEQEAQTALSRFKSEITGTGMTTNDILYAGKNANVKQQTKESNEQTLDFWGNPVKKTNTTQAKKTTTQPQPQTKKPKLDYWGNPIKQ